jgi:hypothetical protein
MIRLTRYFRFIRRQLFYLRRRFVKEADNLFITDEGIYKNMLVAFAWCQDYSMAPRMRILIND